MTLDRERGGAAIRHDPVIRLVTSERHAELAERRRLASAYPMGLGKADAERLQAVLDEVAGKWVARERPWLDHVDSHLTFMQMGRWEEYARSMTEKGTPFGPFDEILARVQNELCAALVEPRGSARPRARAETSASRPTSSCSRTAETTIGGRRRSFSLPAGGSALVVPPSHIPTR